MTALSAVLISQSQGTSFDDWRTTHFTSAQLADPTISGPDADPDGDKRSNFVEYALGSDPWSATAPPLSPSLYLDYDNLPHLSSLYRASTDSEGVLILPQVTDNLGTRWRADDVGTFYAGYVNGQYEYLTIDNKISTGPNRRFLRLLIAKDLNGDGCPDDLALAWGLNPGEDAFKHDSDGDGDSDLEEFLHGTDPLNASDNSRRDLPPDPPENVQILCSGDGSRQVVWDDRSNNEEFFVIYSKDSAGQKTEIGRVGPGQTWFALPVLSPSVAGISVSSGNQTATSSEVDASGYSSTAIDISGIRADSGFKNLTIPTLAEVRRLDLNRVKIRYEGGVPTFSDPADRAQVELILLRQFVDGEWEAIYTSHPGNNDADAEYIDNNAPIDKAVRYTAITKYTNLSFPSLSAASSAAPPKVLDYVKGQVGAAKDNFTNADAYNLSPPGFGLSGNKADFYRIVVPSADGNTPAFIQTNPPLSFGQQAPLIYEQEDYRYFTFPSTVLGSPAETKTELSSEGYFIRGQKFRPKVKADVWNIYYEYTYFFLRPPVSGYFPLNSEKVEKGTGNITNKITWTLPDTDITLPAVTYYNVLWQGQLYSKAQNGFDDVTYFALQHLRGGTSASRDMWYDPTTDANGPITVTKSGGTFNMSTSGAGNFTLVPTTSTLDTTGKVTESASKRDLKVVTLPPRHWTVGLYRAYVWDNILQVMHPPLELPVTPATATSPEMSFATRLQNYLNDVYGESANITFEVTYRGLVTVNDPTTVPDPITGGIPLVSGYPAATDKIKGTLWATADPHEDLAIFYMEVMPPGTAAQCFEIPSRGLCAGPPIFADNLPPGLVRDGRLAVAHEIGHCLGLHHCWELLIPYHGGMDEVPDEEAKRLMGYSNGVRLRHREVLKISDTNLNNIEPLTGVLLNQ